MYFPYLRGRQFELIALRELVEKTLMCTKIIPIIEPVKLSSTLITTINCFEKNKRKLALIANPQVGDFNKNLNNKENSSLKEKFIEVAKLRSVINTHVFNPDSENQIIALLESGVVPKDLISICCKQDYISTYEKVFSDEKPQYNLILGERMLKRKIKENCVLLEDKFNKKKRNSDYAGEDEDESFSDDHIYYTAEGYVGFSDYSVIGNEYVDSGFAPYAVAIHIVYFDEENSLRIRHFVSDTNDDIHDTSTKFSEAVGKLYNWNKKKRMDTYGIKTLEQLYKDETFPGLGSIKKLSIMHHLELMSRYLDGAIKK